MTWKWLFFSLAKNRSGCHNLSRKWAGTRRLVELCCNRSSIHSCLHFESFYRCLCLKCFISFHQSYDKASPYHKSWCNPYLWYMVMVRSIPEIYGDGVILVCVWNSIEGFHRETSIYMNGTTSHVWPHSRIVRIWILKITEICWPCLWPQTD